MKSITLTLDDALYEAVETEASRRQTSVSAVVEGCLRTLRPSRPAARPDRNEEEEERRNREDLVRSLAACKLELGYPPTRERTYEGGRYSRF